MKKTLLLPFLAAAITASSQAAAPAPIKILLITGGCCHDYATQQNILKKGLEERANVIVDQMHVDDKSVKPPLPLYGNPEYAKGYDLVIHDECASDVIDLPTVEGVLKPHRDGLPGVNLHCAMHSYGKGNHGKALLPNTAPALWDEYLGLQSFAHGKQLPITIKFTDPKSPILNGQKDWTTVNEELYNNFTVFPTAHPLANGEQTSPSKSKAADGTETVTDKVDRSVVVWTNLYGKTRVFSTTIGHNNATVADPRYLDLVTHGVLWAVDKLDANGNPLAGYGPGGK